jgi:hypothetical protein
MTAWHIATVYFDGKKEAAKKRLQKIKNAGLIGERKRRVNEPAVLFLTRKAHTLLNQQACFQNSRSFLHQFLKNAPTCAASRFATNLKSWT